MPPSASTFSNSRRQTLAALLALSLRETGEQQAPHRRGLETAALFVRKIESRDRHLTADIATRG
jgi:hypothetical protein